MKQIVYLFFFVILYSICLPSCLKFRRSDKSYLTENAKDKLPFDINYLDFNQKRYRYLFYQHIDQSKPLLVLIHGAPGSSDALHFYIKDKLLRDHFSIILVDRFGYGYSDYGIYSSMFEQAQAIDVLVKSVKRQGQKVFIAGHSYGATITAVHATLQPEYLTASIMMAPALDPDNEKYFWFSKLGKWKATKWMAAGALETATDEKYNHAAELRIFAADLPKIKTPIFHIHGTKDNVVPFENLAYSQLLIPKKYLTTYVWKGMKHTFPFTHEEKVVKLIYDYFKNY